MTIALREPSATADAVELADYLELMVLQAVDRNASVHDLLQDMNIAATAELLDVDPSADEGLTDPDDAELLVDPGGDVLESLGASALAEIESREIACGGAYPFSVDSHGLIELQDSALSSPYTFMLLLTRFGGKPKSGTHRVSPLDGTHLFEELCGVAAAEYFGWDDEHVLVYPFGFPRKHVPSGFRDAIDDMCGELHEGLGHKETTPNVSDQQDGGLDLVVARRFPDRRPGQLVGFGQCATGNNWRDKLSELQPKAFCDLWLREPLAVPPIRLFFVPHTIEDRIWVHTAQYAGVVFDRCRISFQSTFPANESLNADLTSWTIAVLDQKVRPQP